MSHSPHQMAVSHIVLAQHEVDKGNHSVARQHLRKAQAFAESHSRVLKTMGQHDESKKYMDAFQEHVSRINSLMSRKAKKSECSEDHQKMDVCKCGYMRKSEPMEKIEPKQPIKSPGQDPRYHYKPIHELSDADQAAAYHKFSGKDIARYMYPVDKETGALVHASRAPLPADKPMVPRPLSADYQKLGPHHQRDSSIRINAPGHPMHGKLGVVAGANPAMGGKIAVKMGTSAASIMHFDPEQVKPSQPAGKIEKALVAYWGIQKALLKA